MRVLLPGGGVWYDGATGAAMDVEAGGAAGRREINVPVSIEAIQTYLRGGQMVMLKER